MHRFRILCLLISSCIALLFSSCAVQTVKGFAETAPVADTYAVSYFSDATTDYVYKANIAIYGKEFGGIFIAKKINDTTHRVAFTTEFGNKLFDFEISDTDFKVNYILEELDRKIIVNTLRHDFTLLLKKNHQVIAQFTNDSITVYKSSDANRHNYLFVSKQSKQLEKMVHATKTKEKIIFTYAAKSNTLAQNIVIAHKNIQLEIELNYINN